MACLAVLNLQLDLLLLDIYTEKSVKLLSNISEQKHVFKKKCNYKVCHLILELLESFQNTKLSGVLQILCCNNRQLLRFGTKQLLYSLSLRRLLFGANLGNLIFLSERLPPYNTKKGIKLWQAAARGCGGTQHLLSGRKTSRMLKRVLFGPLIQHHVADWSKNTWHFQETTAIHKQTAGASPLEQGNPWTSVCKVSA